MSAPAREVRYEYSLGLAPLLYRLRAALLVSTYQAGKLVVVGAPAEDQLVLTFHNFQQVMGVAYRPGAIAVGATGLVWFLRSAPELAARLEPAGRHDGCFLTRSAHYTGEIQVHELAWAGDELWLVNTLFSCLCTLQADYSFVPRWRPAFISSLAAEDRCHVNGFCLVDGRPRYVTVLGETDIRQGWRSGKATGGCVLSAANGAVVARGFAMPHSPRVHAGRLWVLDSGAGRLVTVDAGTGKAEPVAPLPGYGRGLAFHDSYAFVGLSRARERSTFGGVPLLESGKPLVCGVAVLDLASGRPAGLLEFHSGVEEIFDVQVVPGLRLPAVSGPYPDRDGGQPVWLAPGAAS
jgi:uncharacterized protein (TIGR03032 family)